jgi:hypothetical protein
VVRRFGVLILLWIVAIALLVFWLFGLILDVIGTLIWIVLIAAVVILVWALFQTLAGRRNVP